MITTSEIKISVLVDRQYAQDALRTVHEAFQLHKPPEDISANAGAVPAQGQTDAAKLVRQLECVARLELMEKLIIDNITLDQTQSLVTFVDLPDMPGLAAQTFDELAEAGIVVDMIVQSIGRENRANISVTVPRKDLKKALGVAKNLSQALKCPEPTHSAEVAKLSVFGTGIRSHAGVATRMFKAMSEAERSCRRQPRFQSHGSPKERIRRLADRRQRIKGVRNRFMLKYADLNLKNGS
jgi:aspartate kinase